MTAGYTIVRAGPEHTEALPAIELRAAGRFRDCNVPQVVMQQTTPPGG